MSEKKLISRFSQPVTEDPSPTLTKPFSKKILLPLLGIIVGYALSFIPVGYGHSSSVKVIHDTVSHYIPHQAPKDSYLGKYEDVKGAFKVKEDTAITITDHQWRLDTANNQYLTNAHGYIMLKKKDGSVEKASVKILENKNYNLFNPHAAPFETIHFPDIYQGLDSALVTSLRAEGIYSRELWRSVRPDQLPYRFVAAGKEYTVDNYTTAADSLHPNVFVTMLFGTNHPINGKDKPKDFKLTETRTITIE